jgi:hypothetical protein
MNHLKIFLPAVILFCFTSGCKAQSQTNSLRLIETIPLQNVIGRIDHLQTMFFTTHQQKKFM